MFALVPAPLLPASTTPITWPPAEGKLLDPVSWQFPSVVDEICTKCVGVVEPSNVHETMPYVCTVTGLPLPLDDWKTPMTPPVTVFSGVLTRVTNAPALLKVSVSASSPVLHVSRFALMLHVKLDDAPIPATPVGPIGPVGPVGPVTPWTPAGPVVPVAPVAPVAPAGPVGPIGPVD